VDRSQVRKIMLAVMTQKAGRLAEFNDTCLDEIVVRVPRCVECPGTDSIPQDASAWDEIALPVLFEIAGVPGVRHSRPGYWTLYRRRTRSLSSAAVMVPRAYADLVGTGGVGAARTFELSAATDRPDGLNPTLGLLHLGHLDTTFSSVPSK
jgi:hypothetical protein